MDYQQGTAVTLQERFSVNGTLTDPTTIVFHVVDPDGVEVAYEFGVDGNVIKQTDPDAGGAPEGVYDCDLGSSLMLGTWIYWGVGTGAVNAQSTPRSFRVVSATANGTGDQGPCEPWISPVEVGACNGVPDDADQDRLQEAADAATEVLYALVPRFSGVCGPITVRPCGNTCGAPWRPNTSVSWTGTAWWYGDPLAFSPEARDLTRGCGCSPAERVLLSGRVLEVREVKIDGVVVDPDAYQLDNGRWLTRVDGDAWPGCQDDNLPDTEAGTFSVTYIHGVQPPVSARIAARELAAAIYQTCASGSGADCVLPTNVTRIVREGITLDLTAFTGWGYNPDRGQWQTGMPMVDMFLNAFNPYGRRKRRTIVWSPDMDRAAPRLVR